MLSLIHGLDFPLEHTLSFPFVSTSRCVVTAPDSVDSSPSVFNGSCSRRLTTPTQILLISNRRLDCCWPSPAPSFLPSGSLEIHDQDFSFLLDMYVFRNGVSSSTRGRGRFFFCVKAMFIAP
jgi:hypothetical protein